MSLKGVQWFWSNYQREFDPSFQEKDAVLLEEVSRAGDHAETASTRVNAISQPPRVGESVGL